MAKKIDSNQPPAGNGSAPTKPSAKRTISTTPASAAPKKSAPKKSTSPASVISTDDIALRAYFIAENRRANGMAGDEHQDWIEAERQLNAEAQQRKSAGKSTAEKAVVL